tara:strand:+ start:1121 stop:1507 length:387 start_codon:yes stop_codon:yes gene_type:complete
MSIDFSFPKKDRLVGEKRIRLIFDKGEKTKDFPFLFYFMPISNKKKVGVQVAFGVSKKTNKLAVVRNKKKRQIKEAFRLKKPFLINKMKKSYAIIIVYLAEDLKPQELLSKKIKSFFVRLINSSNEVI